MPANPTNPTHSTNPTNPTKIRLPIRRRRLADGQIPEAMQGHLLRPALAKAHATTARPSSPAMQATAKMFLSEIQRDRWRIVKEITQLEEEEIRAEALAKGVSNPTASIPVHLRWLDVASRMEGGKDAKLAAKAKKLRLEIARARFVERFGVSCPEVFDKKKAEASGKKAKAASKKAKAANAKTPFAAMGSEDSDADESPMDAAVAALGGQEFADVADM